MTNLNFSTQERFWSKVDVRGPDNCWVWIAGKTHDGYGQLRLGGTAQYTHRIGWELANGQIPSGLCVLHHCDNPGCVNPAHLFLGTRADNVADMISKGRRRTRYADMHGENGPNARLKKIQVMAIRHWLKKGYTQRKIAKVFGVGASTISRINRGEGWSYDRPANEEGIQIKSQRR